MLTKELKTKIVLSSSFDPWYNLALEEYLLDNVEEDEVILYLWQNANTVVIGSNQNTWKECRISEIEKNKGKIARRLSGGGAVFHDLGNLNFTFILSKQLYDLDKQLSVIINAVRKQGINAKFVGRNDIEVEGKKFSGNAFYFTDRTAYHHGTILIDVDISKLTDYLKVSEEKIVSKGIDSVQARVINLKNLNSNITIESMKKSLKESFVEIYPSNCKEYLVEKDDTRLQELYSKYSSWNWIYGESPSFDIVFENKFSWGAIELCLSLKKAIIEKAVIYSDAMNNKLIARIADSIKGATFNIEEICSRLKTVNIDENEKIVLYDLCNWLESKKEYG